MKLGKRLLAQRLLARCLLAQRLLAQRLLAGCLIAQCLLLAGCSDSGETSELSGLDSPAHNVTQGGAQDIGAFRRSLADGEVPSLDSLDDVGFFAEHAIDMPEPDCGASVCAHPMLAVAPQFDGSNWTMAFLGFNTALTAADLPQLPRHFLVILERSRAVDDAEAPILSLAQQLLPDDYVTTIELSATGIYVRQALRPDALEAAHSYSVPAEGAPDDIDLYSALFEARELSLDPAWDGYLQRVLVFGSGAASGGVTSELGLRQIAYELAASDVGVSTFGLGEHYQVGVLDAVADSGAGNAYIATLGEDLDQAITVEVGASYHPIARDLRVEIEVAEGYQPGEVCGARSTEVDGNIVTLRSPVLFLGARRGSEDNTGGRRGGGGGWMLHLDPDSAPGSLPTQLDQVASVQVSYTDALRGELVVQTRLLQTPLGAGNNPGPEQPYFSDEQYAKPFMMLNMFLGLRSAITHYEQGGCDRALAIEDMMGIAYGYWSEQYSDADIDADYELIQELSRAIGERCLRQDVLWPVEEHITCWIL